MDARLHSQMRQETLLQNGTTGSGTNHASHPAGTVVSFPGCNGVGPTLRMSG